MCSAYMPGDRSHEPFYLTSFVEYFVIDAA